MNPNWHIDPPTAGRLRTWMQQQGLPGCELARQLNWSPASMTRVLTGQRGWGAEKRRLFIEQYGIDTYRELFNDVPLSEEIKFYQLTEGAK